MSSSSRQNILAAIGKNKPAPTPLPLLPQGAEQAPALREKFTEVAVSIGSRVFSVGSYKEVAHILLQQFGTDSPLLAVLEDTNIFAGMGLAPATPPHELQAVELAILRGEFGVAENSAIWIQEAQMGHRVLPFICQHLALVISQKDIVPTMHEAYARIGEASYGYGAFIAGPSKTADIEQSLVLGAHGPRSLTVFILTE